MTSIYPRQEINGFYTALVGFDRHLVIIGEFIEQVQPQKNFGQLTSIYPRQEINGFYTALVGFDRHLVIIAEVIEQV